MRWRPVAVSAAVVLSAACVHRPPPPLGTARLVVQRSGPGFRAYVRAMVAGEPMTLLVDTGAIRSMLPARFARERMLRVRSSAADAQVVDANGRLTRMPTLPAVPVQFEGEQGAGTIDFLMNPWGEEAILAPQTLVRRGWVVVIDLGREVLSLEPEEAALQRLAANGPAPRKVDFSGCLDEGLFEKAHRYVSTTINGVPARMLIDTGAGVTALARNNPALPSMTSAEGQRGIVAGVASTGHGLVVDGVPLVFSETTFTLSALVIPASLSCGHGALGADVLRHCTIVWGWSSLWAACRAPARS